MSEFKLCFGLSSLTRSAGLSHWYTYRRSSGFFEASGVARSYHLPVVRQTHRRCKLRIYVMLPAAIEQERLFVAERLLTEIERRHGLPHPAQREIHPVIVDRFLTAYLPETRDGEPAPLALEYAFSPSLSEALDLMREVVTESPSGCGAALYVHDLDTGI